MYTQQNMFMKCLVIVVVILVLTQICYCGTKVRTKFKRKVGDVHAVANNYAPEESTNVTNKDQGRGFGSLFSLSKVFNFFPVGGERECRPRGFHAARAGICLNPYDCRQRDGRSAGDCAYGFGVCCVFEVSCGGVVQNNLTYFMSPGFPDIWMGNKNCDITIEKTHAGITQLRIDFVHLAIGQPNRRTGACDGDAMVVGEGNDNFTLCGQNHGQHIYYNLPTQSTRRDGELSSIKDTRISFRLRGGESPRIWLLRLAQLPLALAAPHDCAQYYTADNGTIQSFNYATNGRHLASQHYRACVRRNEGRCGVRYAPCDADAFRIAPGGMGAMGMDGASGMPGSTQQEMQQEELMPVGDMQMQDEEGSGADPNMAPAMTRPPAKRQPKKGWMGTIWSYIWPSWLWDQSRTLKWRRWSPYSQHYGGDDKYRYYGYGNFGAGMLGFGRQKCNDRVTIPCENEYFVSPTTYFSGVCDPHHCGNSFCPGLTPDRCHVETSVAPFAVTFNFGPPVVKADPEENIGACLRYTQLGCDN